METDIRATKNESPIEDSQEATALDTATSEATDESQFSQVTRRKRLRKKAATDPKSPAHKQRRAAPKETKEVSFLKPRGRPPKRNLLSTPSVNNQNVDNTDTTANPPPIFVKNVLDIKRLTQRIATVVGKDNFLCRARFNDTAIYAKDSESFRKVVHFLNEMESDFHCYQLKEDKSFRVVIRNLHHTTPADDIKAELTERGYNVKNVHNAKHPILKSPLPLFFIDLAKEPKSKEIFKEQVLQYTKIKVEEPRVRKEVVQCTRCLAFGHTANYCFHTAKCVKCAEEHPTKDCPYPRSYSSKCANCDGNHPASYKGCTIYKAMKALRKRRVPPQPTTPAIDQPSTSQQPPPRTLPQTRPVTAGVSYSAIVNHQQAEPLPVSQPTPNQPSQPAPQRQIPPRSSLPNHAPAPQHFDPNTLFQSFFNRLESLLSPLITLLTTLVQQCLPILLKK